MKAFSSKFGRLNGAIHTLAILPIIALMTLTGRADTLLVCTNGDTGDFYFRGFYVPNYPGNSLDSARLVFSSPTAGRRSASKISGNCTPIPRAACASTR